MSTGTIELAERRAQLEAAREALTGFGEALSTASAAELTDVLALVDTVAALASAARVAVAVEATGRGEVAGGEVAAWLRENAPSLRQGGAAAVARIALEVSAAGSGLTRRDPDPSGPVGQVWVAVRDGWLDAGTGCAVLREVERLRPMLHDEALPTVTDALVDLAATSGTTEMRRLRPALIARYGHDGELDDLHARLACAARLSSPRIESGDLTEYQLAMTPEQAATLEAALGPLSAPAPNPETGEADLRPAGQRRVEALTELCLAAGSAAAATDLGAAATLHVTIALADLQAGTGAGEVLDTVADGTLLSAETLRRLACDAALIPHVLGSDDQPLTIGRVLRLFTRAQRRHLGLRDRRCTFPGCTAPAAWARAHHVRHWVDGGATDVANAALLCQRHHTTVHRRRLWAEVRQRPDQHGHYVTWDLTDGSYDRALAALSPPQAEPHVA
ncbi:HNH endonuclease [Phycicoccus avicenniae]|uniref:HNH endonuclease signature motif containing protein n=1 Tax=Phycicoccus avicenniae TaxID=2828860 RepID=UPI003D28117E